MKKWKIGGIAVLVLLLVIIVLQNTEAVETNILFISFQMPRALLLFGTTMIGFFIGLITSVFFIGENPSK